MNNGFDLLRNFLVAAPDSWEEVVLTFKQIEVFLDAAPEKTMYAEPELQMGLRVRNWKQSGFGMAEVDTEARTVKFVRVR